MQHPDELVNWLLERYSDGELSYAAFAEAVAAALAHPPVSVRRRLPLGRIAGTVFVLLFPALWHGAALASALSLKHGSLAHLLLLQAVLLLLDLFPVAFLTGLWSDDL